MLNRVLKILAIFLIYLRIKKIFIAIDKKYAVLIKILLALIKEFIINA